MQNIIKILPLSVALCMLFPVISGAQEMDGIIEGVNGIAERTDSIVVGSMAVDSVVMDTIIPDFETYQSVLYPTQPKWTQRGFWRWLKQNISGSETSSAKPFDYTLVAGPYYSATTSFCIAAGVTGQYRWDRADTLLQKSSVSAVAQVSIKGMVSAEITGTNFMKHDKLRWNYRLKWQMLPMDFWGVGYEAGRNHTPVELNRNRVFFRPEVLARVARNFYAGASMNINYTNVDNMPDPGWINDQSKQIFATGIGPIIQYDSRDNINNAYRGIFFRAEQLFYPAKINKMPFYSTDLTLAGYQKLWKGAVGCFEAHGWFNYGNEIPWTMLAQVADNSSRMRGYYEGRYRDRNIMELQVELRQKVWKRLGVTVFAGAANVFDYFDNIQWKQTLPNYGVGLRYEFKKRTNVRLDLGFTKDKPSVVFNIYEAF